MLLHEPADAFDRPAGLFERGEGLKDVNHAIPDLQLAGHAGGLGRVGQARRIVEQDFGTADLDEQRWQTFERSEEG